MNLTINKVSPSKICEVCHQADLFDKEKLICLRCQPVINSLQNNSHQYVTHLSQEEALRRVQNRFAALDKRTAFNNKLMFIYILSLGISVFAGSLILNSINPSSIGLLLILSCILINIGWLIIKRLSLVTDSTKKEKDLAGGLVDLARIARKYRRVKQ